MARREHLASVEHEPRDLADFIEALPDAYLLCRELGHTWKPWRASTDGRAYDRVLKCPRCKTERHQVLTMRGHVVSNRYEYPERYLTKGLGSLSGDDRDSLRLASLTRSTVTVTPAAESA
jgi:hypothetical protein